MPAWNDPRVRPTQFLIGALVALVSSPLIAISNPNYQFQFEIQSWIRSCKNPDENGAATALRCDLARAHLPSQKLSIDIELPKNPGEANSATTSFEFNKDNTQNKLKGAIKVFAIHPNSQSPWPPYFQIQFETFSPQRIFCSQSLRATTPMSIPTFTCSTNTFVDNNLKQLGFNIIQK